MRVIDPKFHIETDQIVKTSNGDCVPEDEPLILIRARDHLALPLLRIYYQLSLVDGCTDYHLSGLLERIAAFEQFKHQHAERMKQPGVTRGA